ncbi:hypothetical protein HYALB_00006410 [Hymenoscyphus albidus]|uniref:Uncharacterized protein n=1 Tax=Hymenoscyphus albidus TaxID=595503 RepID=A0A9N9LNG3_9HELO|nr:hypothetical protein HYALB_00006410 [Hymenoscyphus albidus]
MVFICLIIIPVLAVTSGTDSIRKVDIAPFVFECNRGTGWSWVGINLVVATDFSFGTAKAIDLAWNWIIGRGLQCVLSILAYRVFCDAIMRAAELTPMSYEL